MPKKKKTQLKPVNRGFATTSIASKKNIAEEQAKQDAEAQKPTELATDVGTSAGVEKEEGERKEKTKALSEEETEMQAWVEKWQEKTEREIGRSVKAIEVERRLAEGYISLQLETAWRDRILDLVRQTGEDLSPLSSKDNEEKFLARLGHLYGVLRRLGVSEETTRHCLQVSRRLELEDALEWIYARSGADKSPWETDVKDSIRTTPRTPSAGYLFTSSPSTPLPSLPSTNTPKLNLVDIANSSPTLPMGEVSSRGSPAIRGLNINDQTAIVTDSDSESEMDPNILQAILRIKLLRLQKRGQLAQDRARISAIEARIKEVGNDYMFSTRIAQAEFVTRKEKFESEELQARLKRGSGPGQLPTQLSTTKKAKAKIEATPQVSALSSAADSSQADEEEETMFGSMMDEPITEEITPTGTVITVKDMAIPKTWSNKVPTTLLSEVISKSDRYATVQCKVVSGSSRAVRSSCTIRWTGGRSEQWVMDTIACRDSTQAEQYVATLALHDIAFPDSLGFAGGPPTNPVLFSYRNMPPVFRQLWDELEVLRKEDDDSANRTTWLKLKEMLKGRMVEGDLSSKVVKEQVQKQKPSGTIPLATSTDLNSEQIVASIQSRQATASYQSMLRQRQQLPIAAYREQIVQTVEDHQVLVLSGETGCGKSTQLPTFIMEHQLSRGKACKIVCTEPRRISAISLAQRVSAELGEPPSAVGTNNSLIGYSIRLESNIAKSTRLAFVTNGIALRMLEGGGGNSGGATIDEVTHLIVDEVHERSIESDFLLIILKSLLEQRPDLRVVLMSATLDADKIAAFFGNCPIIRVPGRTFPVDVHYLEDAVELCGWHIDESSPYARRKKDKYSLNKVTQMEWNEDMELAEDEEGQVEQGSEGLGKRYSATTVSTVDLLDERIIPYDLIVRMLERLCFEDQAYIPFSAAVLIFLPGLNEIRRLHDALLSHAQFSTDAFRIYPLHSSVSSEGQGAVFEIPPTGVRKIVISTNISETGITIPDITAVIDSGKHRQMMFDEKRQLSRLVETFIARSNAAQRRGRAGRVQNGICWHLFTKLRHDTRMAEHPVPELLRLSLSDLALRTKIMNVSIGSSIEEVLAKALDPPTPVNVQRAVASLVEAGALTQTEEITPLGRYLAHLPTDVALGKFLLMATIFKCLDPALTIAAALNSKSPFLTPFGKEDEAERQKASFRIENSDFLTIHNAFDTWRRACANGQSAARTLCRKSFLSYQNLQQIEEIRQQYLTYLIDSSLIQVDRAYERELSRARYNQNRNKPRFVAVPSDLNINYGPGKPAMINAALVAGLYPKLLVIEGQQMRTLGNNQVAYLHPSSINFGRKPRDISGGASCLVYFTLMHSKKLYAWETGPVDDLALVLLCGEADFKLASEAIVLDRKIKFHVDANSVLGLKHLRAHLQKMIQSKFSSRRSASVGPNIAWETLAMAFLGKKTDEPDT